MQTWRAINSFNIKNHRYNFLHIKYLENINIKRECTASTCLETSTKEHVE